MAEIKIEKKKPVWPWILLGLIILAAIIYFVAFADDTDEDRAEETETEQVTDTAGVDEITLREEEQDTTTQKLEIISDYLSHIGEESRMGLDHEYSEEAITKLLNAVQAKADQKNVNIDVDMKEARKYAEQITKDHTATNHSDKIKKSAGEIIKALDKIQKEQYPGLEQDVAEVKTAVEKIDPSVLTLNQKEEINSFFKEAGDVLKKMNQ